MPRSSPFRIDLFLDEAKSLQRVANKYTSSYYSVIRAKIVLMAANGLGNQEIAGRLDLPRQVVSKWRKRFFEQRAAGLQDEPRAGRPPAFPPCDRSGRKGSRM